MEEECSGIASMRFADCVGSRALSLGEVISAHQRVETGSAAHAVQATSVWLQERNMGHDKLLHQIFEYATAV